MFGGGNIGGTNFDEVGACGVHVEADAVADGRTMVAHEVKAVGQDDVLGRVCHTRDSEQSHSRDTGQVPQRAWDWAGSQHSAHSITPMFQRFISLPYWTVADSRTLSIIRATPSSSLVEATSHPRSRAISRRPGALFPMATGRPTKLSISRSLKLSPMAMASDGGMPRLAASFSRAMPLEQPGGRMSRMERSRAGYSVRCNSTRPANSLAVSQASALCMA